MKHEQLLIDDFLSSYCYHIWHFSGLYTKFEAGITQYNITPTQAFYKPGLFNSQKSFFLFFLSLSPATPILWFYRSQIWFTLRMLFEPWLRGIQAGIILFSVSSA